MITQIAKIIILFAIFLSLECYSETVATSGNMTIFKNGVVQTQTFTQQYTAIAYAINLSKECLCEVTIRIPDIKINSKPEKIVWDAPKSRTNGLVLNQSEIAGYEIRAVENGKSVIYKVYNSNEFYIKNAASSYSIATIDRDGYYSDFVKVGY